MSPGQWPSLCQTLSSVSDGTVHLYSVLHSLLYCVALVFDCGPLVATSPAGVRHRNTSLTTHVGRSHSLTIPYCTIVSSLSHLDMSGLGQTREDLAGRFCTVLHIFPQLNIQ